jgi:creatinine amidohydrolase
MMTVEFQKLRPKQIAACKRDCNVAYLPIGILEWHGFHNPYGLDTLKALGIAKHLAVHIGGLVMPPISWSDHRAEICERHLDKVDAFGRNAADVICSTLEVPRDHFAVNAQRSTDFGGWTLFKQVVVHSLFQIECYGFDKVILIPGHYPLFTSVQEAIDAYKERGGVAQTLMLHDGIFSETGKGDHAAEYETSLMMAIDSRWVDIRHSEEDMDKPPIGTALGRDPRIYASKEKGEAALMRMVEHYKGVILT